MSSPFSLKKLHRLLPAVGRLLAPTKKETLRFPLPVGFCYDEEGCIIQDPDQEVRSAIKLLFETFQQSGSGYAVVQKFGRLKLKFPKRAYGGVWKGKLIWGHLTYERASGILKNPCYAGVYVYGRHRQMEASVPRLKRCQWRTGR